MDFSFEEWQKKAKPPREYIPTGFSPSYIHTCSCINWFGLRSPLCYTTSCGNSCASILGATPILLTNEEDIKPLMNGIHKNCPDEYTGVFWLRDLTQHSSLITLHDADWNDTSNGGTKRLKYNWIKANTCYGLMSTCAFVFADSIGVRLKFEISPNGEWILFSYPLYYCGFEIGVGPRQWIYVYKYGGSVTLSDGSSKRIKKNDMMRIDFKKWNDPDSPITYMYLVERLYPYTKCNSDTRDELVKRALSIGEEPFFICDKNYRIPAHLLPNQHIIRVKPQEIHR
jgi:hypothetical protein